MNECTFLLLDLDSHLLFDDPSRPYRKHVLPTLCDGQPPARHAGHEWRGAAPKVRAQVQRRYSCGREAPADVRCSVSSVLFLWLKLLDDSYRELVDNHKIIYIAGGAAQNAARGAAVRSSLLYPIPCTILLRGLVSWPTGAPEFPVACPHVVVVAYSQHAGNRALVCVHREELCRVYLAPPNA